jgi:hypothetical protein
MRKKQQEEEPAPRKDDRPPPEFCDWWNPRGTEEPSGAEIGGHPDAERIWSRKDPGRFTRRRYGINASTAWLCQVYRNEFNAWLDAGKPKKEPFVSVAAPLFRQSQMWKEIYGNLKQIAEPDAKKEEQERRRQLQDQKVKLLHDKQLPVIDAEFEPIDFNHTEETE